MPYTVLVTAPTLSAPGLKRLEEAQCRVLFVDKDEAQIELLMATEAIDAVISRTLTLSKAAMKSCPTLRVISKHGAGVNNIDIAGATELGLPVYFTAGANAQAVAELTFGLLLSVARKIPLHNNALHEGQWVRSGDGTQLAGRVFGIIGLGQIGRRVAKIAEAFGMSVIAYDPYVNGGGVRMVTNVADIMRDADVVSLHCPLTPITKGFIGAAEIALLRKSAILVNASRGGIVDESALIDALSHQRILGAGIDTFAIEPLPANSPFCSLSNVVLTPHVGGSTRDALDSVGEGAARTAIAHLRGEAIDLTLCVNPDVLRVRSAASAH
jgi:D-3-phosphoglycerate dehydrogenase